jgi:hypothetical protein
MISTPTAATLSQPLPGFASPCAPLTGLRSPVSGLDPPACLYRLAGLEVAKHLVDEAHGTVLRK